MKKEIFIIYPFYQAGGFEKWAASVASSLQINYSVHAVIMGPIEVDFGFYGETISYTRIDGILRVMWHVFLKRPDILISSFTKWNAIFSILCLVMGIKHIASVHLTLSSRKDLVYRIYQQICAVLYSRLAASVICVSKGIKDELSNIKFVCIRRCEVLYNPCFRKSDISLTPKKMLKFQHSDRRVVKIISAGRLHYQKGFDLLIYGLNTSRHKNNIELNIFGEGPELAALLQLKNSLGLENVNFMGVSKEIAKEYLDHDIFILSSRYEGFGNVLAEALASGLLCTAFDIKYGPSEILLNGKYGFLVPDLDPVKIFNIVDDLIDGNLVLNFDDHEAHCSKFTFEKFSLDLSQLIKKVLSS